MISRIISAVVVIIAGIAGLFLLKMLAIDEIYQDIGIELYGAVVVALLTWAIVTPAKNVTVAKQLHQNHQDLFSFVAHRERHVKTELVDHFIMRTITIASSYNNEETKNAFKAYIEALETFSEFVENTNPQYIAQGYRGKWNETNVPFHKLLKRLNSRAAKTFVTDKTELKVGKGKGFQTSFLLTHTVHEPN